MPKRKTTTWKRKDEKSATRYIRYHLNGKAKYSYTYAKSYMTVKRKRSAAQTIAFQNQENCPKAKINDLLDSFLQSKKRSVKEPTFANYFNIIEKHIRPYFKNYDISCINNSDIENFANFLITQGRLDHSGGLSNKSAKDILIVLKMFLSFASSIRKNIISKPIFIMPKVETKINIWTKEDQKVLESYLEKHLDLWGVGILLALKLGLRIGEICALTWKNIDLLQKTITVTQTVQRISRAEAEAESNAKTKLLIESPKSASSNRILPIPMHLIPILSNIHQKKQNIFLLTGTEYCAEPRNFYRKYKQILLNCHVPDHTFHSLRHTFATNAVECGVDPKSLSEILGHAGIKITLERYVHSSIEIKRNQLEKMS